MVMLVLFLFVSRSDRQRAAQLAALSRLREEAETERLRLEEAEWNRQNAEVFASASAEGQAGSEVFVNPLPQAEMDQNMEDVPPLEGEDPQVDASFAMNLSGQAASNSLPNQCAIPPNNGDGDLIDALLDAAAEVEANMDQVAAEASRNAIKVPETVEPPPQ